MATTTNPTMSSLVPGGMNPTGTPINAGTFSASSGNPYQNVPVVGANNANPYASTIPSPNIGGTATGASQDLTGAFGSFAPYIQQLLSSGGGYNPQAISAILAQMQPGIQQGQQNVAEEFGAAGGRFSSAAATGIANYNSQVNLNEGDIMSQLYEQSYQNYMNEVMGIGGQVAQYNQSKPSAWDIISGLLGVGTSAYSTFQGGQNASALAGALAM
jgi:hypothetical protein